MNTTRTNTVDVAPILLTPDEVSALLNISKQRLRRLRRAGQGPAYHNLGSSLIRYNTTDIHHWSTTTCPALPPGNPSPPMNL